MVVLIDSLLQTNTGQGIHDVIRFIFNYYKENGAFLYTSE